jgi:outer membrane murein-binding lipoprotein Lpp
VTTTHFVTLLCVLAGGIGVIAAGVWRVAGAVFKLASKVDLLAYRIEQIEKKQAVPVRPRRI